jgi:hypothetical protein
MNAIDIKKTACLCLGIILGGAMMTSCRSRKNSGIEVALRAEGLKPFYIDLSLMNLDSIDPPPPLANPERLKLIEEWVNNSNSWFLPFIVRYLPSLKSSVQRRILPILGSPDESLLTAVNDNDIEVNLVSNAWTANDKPLTSELRSLVISSVLEKQILTQEPAKKISGGKAKLITEIYRAGIPAYLGSFGSQMDDSALSIALNGNRSEIEKYFELLRNEMLVSEGRPPEHYFNEMNLDAPIRREDAVRLVGLWISYRIELTLGSDPMIQAIKDGPERLYELYLSINPGILRSLEFIPEEVKPLLNDSITH